MRNYIYPCATGIAMVGAGAALALGAGAAQASPLLAPAPAPLTSLQSPSAGVQCLMVATGCPSGVVTTTSGAVSYLALTPTPNALAAAFVGPTMHSPLYNLIGIGNFIPIVNIFVSNGTNGAAGTGANGGNGGLLMGFGGAGGSGAVGKPAAAAARAGSSWQRRWRRSRRDRRVGRQRR